jgi:hypothetical protein
VISAHLPLVEADQHLGSLVEEPKRVLHQLNLLK